MTDTEKVELSEDELRFYKEMVNLRNESFTIPGLKQSDTEHNFYRKLYQYHKAKIEEAEKKLLLQFGIHKQETIPGKSFYVMTLNETVKGYQGIPVHFQIIGASINEVLNRFLKHYKSNLTDNN